MPNIKLHAVICNVPDEPDKDEIFLGIQNKKIWPLKSKFQKVGVDEALALNVSAKFETAWVEIELWDYDYMSKNDHLGSFHLDLTQDAGHYGTILSNNNEVSKQADYMINWEILAE